MLQLDTSALFFINGLVFDPRDPANQSRISDNIRSQIEMIEDQGEQGRGEEPSDFVAIGAVVEAVAIGQDGSVSSFELGGLRVVITEFTGVFDVPEDVPLADVLTVGTRVFVFGFLDDAGDIIANSIEFEDDPPADEVDLAGPIQAINTGATGSLESLVVLGLTISRDSETEFKARSGGEIPPDSLFAGLYVEIDSL